MSLLIIKYPKDLTGRNPNNLVLGEPHNLLVGQQQRSISPSHSAFYTQGLVVRLEGRAEPLEPNVHYVATALHREASTLSGLEACQLIIITDASLTGRILLDYQTVGGEFTVSSDALQQLIDALNLDTRPVTWAELLAKPTAFPPSAHLHDIGDLYGFEYLVEALEAIRQAILLGDVRSHEEIYEYIDTQIASFQAQIDALRNDLTAHIEDFDNPHRTTKAQVGLSLVDNFATASQAQAIAGTAANLFMTPIRVKQAIDHFVGDTLTNHLSDFNNPHKVTKAQVLLGNVDNYATATQLQAEAGTATNLFMTPLRVKQAIDKFVGADFAAHLADLTNPHQVTKTQVGLGNIPNAITNSRGLDSAATLLTAKGMFDHVASGDHDSRYVRKATAENTSLQVVSNQLQAFVAGAWRVVWPPQWQ